MIQIGQKTYTQGWIADKDNQSAQGVLKRAYEGRIKPFCLCSQLHPELTIKHWKNSDTYFLSKMPLTGHRHRFGCDFYGDDESGEQGQALPAKMSMNGRVNIAIECPLRHKPSATEKSSSPAKTSSNRIQRQHWTLRGLLEELWEMADFHKWYPNRKFDRTLGTIKRGLEKLAADIDISKTPLAKVLLVPAWESSQQASSDQNLARLKALTPNEHGAAIIVGRLENLIRSKFNQDAAGLRISLLGQPVWMTPELTARVERQFAQELSEIQLKDRQIMVICTVFRKGETLKAEDVGLMRVSPQFIPADSGYELEVIAKLVRESRRFRKPVRLRGGKILPDFVLTDCDEPVFLEVFGMTTPEYLVRKKEKMAFYSSAGHAFWSWAPNEQSDIPDLPAGDE